MIFLLAAAIAAAQGPASTCPTVLTQEAQACRAIEASKAGQFAEAATAFEAAADLTSATDPARDRALAAAGNMWIAAGQPGKAGSRQAQIQVEVQCRQLPGLPEPGQ